MISRVLFCFPGQYAPRVFNGCGGKRTGLSLRGSKGSGVQAACIFALSIPFGVAREREIRSSGIQHIL